MAEYRLTATDDSVIRNQDNACIPADPANRDYAEYLQWVEDGGEPDPYQPPEEAPPTPTPEQQVLYIHENRLRALEGQPALSEDEFIHAMTPDTPNNQLSTPRKEPLPRPKSRGR